METKVELKNLRESMPVYHDKAALMASVDKFYKLKMKAVIIAVDEELHQVLGKFWEDLKFQNDGKLAVHMILVVWHAINDPLFQELSSELKNVMKWACVLHSIGKLGKPAIEGRDHIYPFISA